MESRQDPEEQIVVLTVRVPAYMRKDLKTLAARNGTSLSAFLMTQFEHLVIDAELADQQGRMQMLRTNHG